MFKKIITNQKLMNVVNWMLCHPDKEYNAMTIGMSCGLTSPSEFVIHLILLDECDMVEVRKDLENSVLYVSLKRDSPLTQTFMELRDIIEERLAASELARNTLDRLDIVEEISNIDSSDLLGAFDEGDKEEIIERVRNYEKLNDDDPTEFFVKQRIAKLDEEGKLEDFISYIRDL